MMENRRKILAMLANGNISVDHADRRLSAIMPARDKSAAEHTATFLRQLLEPKAEAVSRRKVDVRVPLGLLRSGVQIARSLPKEKRGPMTFALGTHSLSLDSADSTRKTWTSSWTSSDT